MECCLEIIGILKQAGNAKKQTDIASEKEILQISATSAMAKSKYGDITKEKLDAELDKNIGNGNYSSNQVDDGIEVTFTNSGRTYLVDFNGNVEKMSPKIQIADAKVVTNSNGTGEDVAANSKTEGTDTLYISFVPTIAGGNITSVTYNGNTIVSQNGVYVLEISKNGDYNFTINATAEGQSISTPYVKIVDKYELRSGIEIGDYVTYIPPTRTAYSEYLTTEYTGYTSNQSLGQEYKIWRILNKYEDGRIDLIPAFTEENISSIYFYGALGYNNAVYLLNDMSDYLYSVQNTDKNKQIKAVSIAMEDITSKMIEGEEGTSISTCTGLKKIAKYISESTKAISENSAYVSNKVGNNVTYNNQTWYPLLYLKQENESDKYYNSPTLETITSNKPSTLTVEITAPTAPEEFNAKDFEDCKDETSKYFEIFFNNNFWIASRSCSGNSARANFGIRKTQTGGIYYDLLFRSDSDSYSKNNKLCPILTLGSAIQVTKCTGANDQNNTHTVVIQN